MGNGGPYFVGNHLTWADLRSTIFGDTLLGWIQMLWIISMVKTKSYRS